MKIETKFNTGDIVRYDDFKKGRICGIEYTSKNGVSYKIKPLGDERKSLREDRAYLIDYGALRHENEITVYK